MSLACHPPQPSGRKCKGGIWTVWRRLNVKEKGKQIIKKKKVF